MLAVLIFLASPDSAAQDVIVAGSKPVKSTRKDPPEPKPAPPKPQPVVYLNINLLSDEDCIVTIDGVRQKDTLLAGKTTAKKVKPGTHRLSAESIATGYVHSQYVKVDTENRKPLEIPIKEQFEAHIKRVEAALAMQQQ